MNRAVFLLPVGIAASAALAIWMALDIGYLAPMAALDVRAEAATDQLAALADREAKLRAALVAATGNGAGDIGPYVTDSAGERSPTAVLLGQVRSAITSAGGVAISTQASQQPLSADYARLAALVRGRFDEAGLLHFVRALEADTPRLLFQSVEVHPLPPGQQGNQPLEVTATLLGFARHAD